jgi:hypothetical protein
MPFGLPEGLRGHGNTYSHVMLDEGELDYASPLVRAG